MKSSDFIIGIHCGHDASVSVLRDGKNIFSISEERITRFKTYVGFPENCLKYIFAHNVVPHTDTLTFASTADNWAIDHYFNRQSAHNIIEQAVQQVLHSYGIKKYTHKFYLHHHAHVASAHYGMGVEGKVLTVTCDGMGDGLSGVIAHTEGTKLRMLYECPQQNSIGSIYAGITSMLGFKPVRHEGKITGLAAYGQADKTLPLFEEIFKINDDGHIARNLFLCKEPSLKLKNLPVIIQYITKYGLKNFHIQYQHYQHMKRVARSTTKLIGKQLIFKTVIREELYFIPYKDQHTPEDWAAGVQEFCEHLICDWVSYWVQKTGIKKVALAGGVFANVKINQRITERCGIDEIFIYPYMADGGLAFGCACMAYYEENDYKPKISRTETMYLGSEYSDEQILSSLEADGKVTYEKSDDIAKNTADLIVARKIVGWFQGRMEFGPRALGARSVVAMPDDPTINDWLNKRMHRTEFMPFAPSVLAEHMHNVFVIEKDGFLRASEYMTITYNVKKKWQDRIGAVNHVDNTARPQMVKKDTNPLYYNMIQHVYEQTGIPMTINTSFNVHEEPIVMTPDDALNALHRGMVDVLAIGNYLVQVK